MGVRTRSPSAYLLSATALPAMSSFTFMAWINPSITSLNGDFQILSKFFDASGSARISLDTTGQYLTLTGTYGSVVASSTPLALGTWAHVAVTLSGGAGGTAIIYHNGVSVATATAVGYEYFPTPTSYEIGGDSEFSYRNWCSDFGAVKHFSRALTAAQIQNEMWAMAPRGPNCEYAYPLFDASYLTDSTGNGHTLAAYGSPAPVTADNPPIAYSGGHSTLVPYAVLAGGGAGAALSGNLASSGTTTAALTVAKALAGGVVAGAVSAGALTVSKTLAGAVAASGVTAGALTVGKAVAGAVVASALTTGGLTIDKALAGAIASSATLSGTVGTVRPLAGTIAASAVLAGAVTVVKPLQGAVAASGVLAGTIDTNRPLAGAIAASAVTAGALLVAKPLAGSIAATATLTGAFPSNGPIDGAIAVTVATTGALTVAKPLAGVVSTAVTLAGSTDTVRPLAGAASASVVVGGNLTVSKPLAGDVAVFATLSAPLSVLKALGGSISADLLLDGALSSVLAARWLMIAGAHTLTQSTVVRACNATLRVSAVETTGSVRALATTPIITVT